MSDLTKALPKREEVDEALTWDLESIFATEEAWEDEFEALKDDIKEVASFQGTLKDSAQNLYNLFLLQDKLSERLGKLYSYAHMRYDQDTTNSFYQGVNQKAESIITVFSSQMSFVVPEILTISREEIDQFIKDEPKLQDYKKTLDEIDRQREHVLSEAEEKLLSEASESLDVPSQVFGMLNNADLTFPKIKNEDGQDVQMSNGRYIRFMESRDRRVRQDAFEAMYDTFGSFKNTFAATLAGNIKKDNFYAKVRKYNSAREAALDGNKIPEAVYDNLVDAIHEKMPLLHRYTALRKEILGVDELHMYDLYTPLVKDVDINFTYEEAKDIVLKALAPLGEEYVGIVKEGFDKRWIDVVENKGKRSGAYSSGSYGTHPFILLNWQGNVNDLFTLVHELGHSLHSHYTRNNQPYRYGNYSIFVAEVASTCNEALLSDYLLKTLEDDKERLYILNHFLEGFRATVFRQTMFAEFEHIIHKKAQDNHPLTAESFTEIYYDLNKQYFGENMIVDQQIGLEWARIPHFYYNYYVYQYATGMSAATALADQILTEGAPAVTRYIDYLKAGSSDFPIEVLKGAGVDMNEKAPIIDALEVFEARLNEFEQLLKA